MDRLSAVGVLFSGLGSLLAVVVSVWLAHRKATNECERRIEEINQSFDRGIGIGRRIGPAPSADLSDWGGG